MLAPEIIELINNRFGEGFDEKKSDIFALGITLFQALFLRLPFDGKYASQDDNMFKYMFRGR